MNEGPLPTSGPPYFPSARINYASDLLGSHIQPYSYGRADHVSDQTSYLNIAHRIPKLVPQISLPNANSEGFFQLSHGVDDGDIAFVLRINRHGVMVPGMQILDRVRNTHTIVDPFVNLVTVNYILAGIQRHWKNKDAVNWMQLMVELGYDHPQSLEKKPFTVGTALEFIKPMGVTRPFGVPHGSENQGGQHEGSSGPVQCPVNHITTMFISGLTRNICNIWTRHDISSGDDLIFRLERLPFAARDGSIKYHLNHWKDSAVIQQYKYEENGVNEGWQLVPAVLSTYASGRMHEGYDYRENGYWHICRSQVQFRAVHGGAVYHDDRVSLRAGALIQATFEPTWIEHIPWVEPRGVKRPVVIPHVPTTWQFEVPRAEPVRVDAVMQEAPAETGGAPTAAVPSAVLPPAKKPRKLTMATSIRKDGSEASVVAEVMKE